MAVPFAALASASQSSDGFTITLTDTSNYGAQSIEGYTPANFTRAFVLVDAYNNVLATLPINNPTLQIQYAVTQSQWINMQLQLTGLNGVPNYTSPIYGLPLDRITKNMYRAILKAGCCGGKFEQQQLLNADNYFTGAAIEALAGNGAGFNNDINAATAWLSPNP